MSNEHIKSLSDLLERQYGARTHYAINPVTDNVDIAVTQVFATNPKRLSLMIMNISASNIFLNVDQQVSAARGILLTPMGGSVSLTWEHDFDLVAFPWYATATADNSPVIAIEVFVY
jgi:hypothetical protein